MVPIRLNGHHSLRPPDLRLFNGCRPPRPSSPRTLPDALPHLQLPDRALQSLHLQIQLLLPPAARQLCLFRDLPYNETHPYQLLDSRRPSVDHQARRRWWFHRQIMADLRRSWRTCVRNWKRYACRTFVYAWAMCDSSSASTRASPDAGNAKESGGCSMGKGRRGDDLEEGYPEGAFLLVLPHISVYNAP